MKFALGLFILAVTLFTISNRSAVASHDSQSTASAVEAADKLDTPRSDVEPMTYPDCSVYQGQPCQQGWTRRCMLAPFEPAFCYCTSSLVYECS